MAYGALITHASSVLCFAFVPFLRYDQALKYTRRGHDLPFLLV